MTGADTDSGLEFRLLGSLEVALDGTVVDLGRGRDRAVLALLVLHANQVVPVDRFVDQLWGMQPPPSAPHALQVHISNLRKRLEPGRARGSGCIQTQPPGYLLRVRPDQIDVLTFERLADDGRRLLHEGEPDAARLTFQRALALWRGPALADLAYEPWAEPEAGRLEVLRLNVTEDCFEAELASGRHIESIGALEMFARQNPLRERAWGLLLLALYRSGRQAEALRAAETLRSTLREELGLDPSPEIRALEQSMLAQDPTLDLVPRPGGQARGGSGAPPDGVTIGQPTGDPNAGVGRRRRRVASARPVAGGRARTRTGAR